MSQHPASRSLSQRAFSRSLIACVAGHLSLAGVAASVLTVTAPSSAYAQSGAAQTRGYNIPAGPLDSTLSRFGTEAGILLSFEPGMTAGLRSNGLNGNHSPASALNILLAGTGLEAVRQADGGYLLLRKAAMAASLESKAATLAEVTVAASLDRSSGTEGSGSYAAQAVSLGKGQGVRELPQSVTVITRQRIEDQGLTSLTAVLEQTTGVTLSGTSMNGSPDGIYSRGFAINNQQIDGVSVGGFSEHYFGANMAMYDSVEVLRGADGLMAGTGEPGGSVNLVRKRPLAEPRFAATLAAGSWNQKRTELDATGPLTSDGRVRGRAVIAHDDRDFFYDTADSKSTLLYGILEADLTNSSTLTLGASYGKSDDHPWYFGIPRATSGADLGLPRSRSLMANWNTMNQTNKELFAEYRHELPGDWRLKFNSSYTRTTGGYAIGDLYNPADLLTGDGSSLSTSSNDLARTRKAVDVNVSGPFSLLGRQHKLLLGFNWQDEEKTTTSYKMNYAAGLPRINIYEFDSSLVPYPEIIFPSASGQQTTRQKGIYGRLNLSLADHLTAVVGARYSDYDYQWPRTSLNQNGSVSRVNQLTYSESGIFTPYLGLIYDFGNRWTAYASAVDIHVSQARYLQSPSPGTPMDPITGRNYELGLKGELVPGRLNAALAIYRINRTGEAVQDPNYPSTTGDLGDSCCYLSRGKVVSQGFDAEISGELARGWQVFAGYTYNENRNKVENEIYNAWTPKHIFRLWSTYRLPGELSAWTIGGGVNAQSASYVSGTAYAYNPSTGKNDGERIPYKFSQGGYAVWNASVQYRFNRNWMLSLNLNNIFDRIYYKGIRSIAGNNFYGDPRNAVVTLRGTF